MRAATPFLLILVLALPSSAQQAPTCDLAALGARFRDGAVGSSWREQGLHTAWLGERVDSQQSWTRVVTRESEERWGVRYLAFKDKGSEGPAAPASGAFVRGPKRWTWTPASKAPVDRDLEQAAKQEARRRSRQAGLADWLALGPV